MTINAYPLTWPQQFNRAAHRESGSFKTTLAGALKNVQDSLRKFSGDSNKKLTNIIISSNVTLGANNPKDPGVAVWFTWDGMELCIPVDRYSKVESNLQAIHHIIEARRVELRHGSLQLVRATFTGFLSLPAPPGTKKWWEVLGVEHGDTHENIEKRYKKLRSDAHPDRCGGNTDEFERIQTAWKQYEAERGQ